MFALSDDDMDHPLSDIEANWWGKPGAPNKAQISAQKPKADAQSEPQLPSAQGKSAASTKASLSTSVMRGDSDASLPNFPGTVLNDSESDFEFQVGGDFARKNRYQTVDGSKLTPSTQHGLLQMLANALMFVGGVVSCLAFLLLLKTCFLKTDVMHSHDQKVNAGLESLWDGEGAVIFRDKKWLPVKKSAPVSPSRFLGLDSFVLR